MTVRGKVVLVTGATGSAGPATCAALAAAGATVVAVGRDEARLAAAVRVDPGIHLAAAELTDPAAVRDLADAVRREHGRIDGLVHLVGGWRGGEGFTANSDSDWAFLSANLIDTLRHVTLAVHDDLLASPAGRAMIVSAGAVDSPTAGNANYATAKAAAETWMAALADSFRHPRSGHAPGESAGDPAAPSDPVAPSAAAVILVINALVHDAMRAKEPDRNFAGFTDVDDLAARIVGLWDTDAARLNGARISLVPPGH